MADIPLGLLPHRVTVEPFTGAGAYDDTYGTAVPNVRCLRDGRVELTSDGQLVDPVTLYCRLQHSGRFVPQSRVTWTDEAGGQVVAYVQVRQERSDGGLGAWQHLEVVVR
jgi:hypothetical protein